MRQLPILFLSDAPEQHTGLARIARDLATLLSREPGWRVGYLGLGATGSCHLPFVQYSIDQRFSVWGERELPRVWRDFAGRETGVLFTCWDVSRCCWLGPERLRPDYLRDFLRGGHFELWGQFPVDSVGPQGKLTRVMRETLAFYNRKVVPSLWAQQLVPDAEWLPHGLNLGTFKPRPRNEGRKLLGEQLHEDDYVMGVVATNQGRKDWGLVAGTTALLKQRLGRGFKAWWHTDIEQRYWDIEALVADFGLGDTVTLTTSDLTELELSLAYSACNVTMHPGLGEGFCFPVAESLACGVPAVVGNYAAAAELVPTDRLKVAPQAYRLDTMWNCVRPVFNPVDWADAIEGLVKEPLDSQAMVDSVAFLSWNQLWPSVWRKWWVKGRQCFGT